MTWMGQIREKQEGGAADAEALYTVALSQEDAHSSDAALTMEVYARFLRGQNRSSEAEAMESRAATLRKTKAWLPSTMPIFWCNDSMG